MAKSLEEIAATMKEFNEKPSNTGGITGRQEQFLERKKDE